MTSSTFFFMFIPLLAFILLVVNLILAPHNSYQEKNNVFECGYSSFLGQNRTQFTISFFIFGLLFLLFDLEILLVYPYSVSGYTNDIYGLAIIMIFFVLLTLGFIFELGKNALNIDSRQMKIFVNTIINYVFVKATPSQSSLFNRKAFGLVIFLVLAIYLSVKLDGLKYVSALFYNLDYKFICDEVAKLANYSWNIEPIYDYEFLFRILLISTFCINIVKILAFLRFLVVRITDILDHILLLTWIYHTRYYWYIFFFRLFYALSFVIIIHITPENLKTILEDLYEYYVSYMCDRPDGFGYCSTAPGKGEPSDEGSDDKNNGKKGNKINLPLPPFWNEPDKEGDDSDNDEKTTLRPIKGDPDDDDKGDPENGDKGKGADKNLPPIGEVVESGRIADCPHKNKDVVTGGPSHKDNPEKCGLGDGKHDALKNIGDKAYYCKKCGCYICECCADSGSDSE